jgi:vacuolar-type H+-ATPase subunit H
MTNDASQPPRGRPQRPRLSADRGARDDQSGRTDRDSPKSPIDSERAQPPRPTTQRRDEFWDKQAPPGRAADDIGSIPVPNQNSRGTEAASSHSTEKPTSKPTGAPPSRAPYSSYAASAQDGARRFIVEDLSDFAKLGGDLLKRTMSSGYDVIKEVKKELPKEASQLISKGKEEVLKGLSKEVMQNVLSQTVDRFFSIVREHKLDVTVSIRLKKADDPTLPEKGEGRR